MARKKRAAIIYESEDKPVVSVRPKDVYVHSAMHGACGPTVQTKRPFDNLILFFRDLGGWYGFTFKQLGKFCKRRNFDRKTMLKGLYGVYCNHSGRNGELAEIDEPSKVYMVLCPDGKLRITQSFIDEAIARRP